MPMKKKIRNHLLFSTNNTKIQLYDKTLMRGKIISQKRVLLANFHNFFRRIFLIHKKEGFNHI
jgi:hypothetical protein